MTPTYLHSRSFGQGPPLVILHGLFGSGDNWQSIAKPFAEHFTVYLIDLVNHGQSFHSHDFTYTDQARYVKESLDVCGLSSFTLLGHSMGGKVAMQLAHDYPEWVETLIVVDIAPKTYPPHHADILKGMRTLPLHHMQDRVEIEAYLAQYIPEKAVRLFLMKSLKRNDQDQMPRFVWQLNVDAIDQQYDTIAASPLLTHPCQHRTLFIRGDASSYISLSDQERLSTHFPNMNVVSIAGAGHWVHAEKPKEFVAHVLDFLT